MRLITKRYKLKQIYMRVLVTGANGFIGQAIVTALLSEKHEVFCLVSFKSENVEKLPNVYRGDITDAESLMGLKALKNIDVVIHSAGLAHQFGKTHDKDFRQINVVGTENTAHLAGELQVRHFILISSVAVYGSVKNKTELIDEKFPCQPQSVYARSKFESEKVARKICENHKVALTVLRLATVLGEDDRGNTARLIKAIDRKRFIWIGNGENHKSLIYKADVADACVKILNKKTNVSEIFNLTGEPVKINFVVAEIAKNLNRKISGIKVPIKLLKNIFEANLKTLRSKKISKLSETVEKWMSEDVFSGDKFAEIYSFRPQTPICEAIRRQVKAYRAKSQK